MKIKTKNNGKKYFEILVPKRVAKLDCWCDKDRLVFIATMTIFEKYVVDELGGIKGLEERIEFLKEEIETDDEMFVDCDCMWLEHYIEVKKLYKFWKSWAKFVDKIQNLYLFKDNDGDMWFYWEEKLTQLEDQMMLRVINIRDGMWT